ncbi:hypothetical protein HanHA300_Chr04g0138471 [Helianthus annuus]|nr:hypothetical protein HanHA300_Chr04g0138471 [Helianthus annuus]KAJ0597170.1 hypothetical protein HanHA89_Chr04g0151431 [Helianthus annuus]KAJ0757851.1 hypothetical protein HanLR1_Chr04g0143521 [Helianthus annuus]
MSWACLMDFDSARVLMRGISFVESILQGLLVFFNPEAMFRKPNELKKLSRFPTRTVYFSTYKKFLFRHQELVQFIDTRWIQAIEEDELISSLQMFSPVLFYFKP